MEQFFRGMKRVKDSLDSAVEESRAASKEALDKATSVAGQAQDVVNKTLESVADKSQVASKEFVNSAASAVDQAQDTAKKTLDMTTSAASDAAKQLQAAYDKGLDTIFPECPVAAFMLPIGPDLEDYVFVFDLDDVLDNLKAGIFVRPKVEVWAGRDSGYDLDRLGRRLKQDFVAQFNEAKETRERLIKAGKVKIKKLESEEGQLSNQLGKDATGAALWTGTGVAALSAGLVVWPLLPLGLLFIALGMGSMSRLTSLIPDYFSTSAKKNRSQRELDRNLRELESQFDNNNRAFQQAVRNIEVKVHPRIREIIETICDVEGVVFLSDDSGPTPVGVPNVEPLLKHPTYLERLPDYYRKLVDPDWSGRDSGRGKRGLFSRLLGR